MPKSMAFMNRFVVAGQATDGEELILIGQPVCDDSEWWKLVSVFAASGNIEVSKVIRKDPHGGVGSLWRIRMPTTLAQNLDFTPFLDEEGNIDAPEPVLTPEVLPVEKPTGYPPLDDLFQVEEAADINGFLVITGQPRNPEQWTDIVRLLIEEGDAREVAKVYSVGDAYVDEVELQYIWRIIAPKQGLQVLETLQPLIPESQEPESKPKKKKGRRRKKKVAAEVTTGDPATDRALKSWRIRNRSYEPPLPPDAQQALARNIKRYQDRLRSIPIKKIGGVTRVTKFPLFQPFCEASQRLTIIEGIGSDGRVSGFTAPKGSGVILTLTDKR